MKFITLELSIEEGQTLVKVLTERLGKECVRRELGRSEKVQLVKARDSIEQQMERNEYWEEQLKCEKRGGCFGGDCCLK